MEKKNNSSKGIKAFLKSRKARHGSLAVVLVFANLGCPGGSPVNDGQVLVLAVNNLAPTGLVQTEQDVAVLVLVGGLDGGGIAGDDSLIVDGDGEAGILGLVDQPGDALSGVGVGIDADVCRVVNVHKKLGYRGKILYVIALLRCLRKRMPVNVRVLSDGATLYDGNIFSIAFGIGKYSGGGMRQTSDAVLDDGLLDVTVIPDIPLGIIAKRAYRLFTDSFTKVKELTVGRGRVVEVWPSDVKPYAEVDGEVIGQAPVRFEIMSSQLNVLGTVK